MTDCFYVSPSLAPCLHSSWLCFSTVSDHTLLALRFADSSNVPWGKILCSLSPRLLKDKDTTEDVAGLLIRSLLGDLDLGGSEWDAVKARVAERFRECGKRWAWEERAGIKLLSYSTSPALKAVVLWPGSNYGSYFTAKGV
ncbi:hypothetical protein MRX96_058071 [Rhipicephalus microplus]